MIVNCFCFDAIVLLPLPLLTPFIWHSISEEFAKFSCYKVDILTYCHIDWCQFDLNFLFK